ncbi:MULTISPECIES: hypothetical protein [unclassified Moraxella]|uniref:hypothetical protein n=1 Tax=unclassified Moraxella TaxID=2685852 RepID=UPI002B402B43|nr:MULTISPECIES: hypothetical protein [unclassified Moraxella]
MLTIEHIQSALDGLDETEQKRTLAVVNAYIKNKGVRLTNPTYIDDVLQVPSDIVLAGVELATAFLDGTFMAGRTEGVIASKSSKAGDVSVSKTYKDGLDGQAISQGQMIADALLEPYVVKFTGLNVPVGRV